MNKIDINNSYIIGDVHGCYNTLLKLVAKLPKGANLIFLGDLCDKGNFSKEVISFVKDNNYLAVKGNHELMMYRNIYKALQGQKQIWNTHKDYGGYKTVKSYQNSPSLLKEHIDWIDSLPTYLEIENYFITHGYALPYYKRKGIKNYEIAFLTNRKKSKKFQHEWEDVSSYNIINIFGHCVFKEVKRGKNFIAIDTGCVYNGKLTALSLKDLTTIDVKCDRKDIN